MNKEVDFSEMEKGELLEVFIEREKLSSRMYVIYCTGRSCNRKVLCKKIKDEKDKNFAVVYHERRNFTLKFTSGGMNNLQKLLGVQKTGRTLLGVIF